MRAYLHSVVCATTCTCELLSSNASSVMWQCFNQRYDWLARNQERRLSTTKKRSNVPRVMHSIQQGDPYNNYTKFQGHGEKVGITFASLPLFSWVFVLEQFIALTYSSVTHKHVYTTIMYMYLCLAKKRDYQLRLREWLTIKHLQLLWLLYICYNLLMMALVYAEQLALPPRSPVRTYNQRIILMTETIMQWKSQQQTVLLVTLPTFPSCTVLSVAVSILSAYSVSPICRSIITALRSRAVGLALSWPAMSGAVPWT